MTRGARNANARRAPRASATRAGTIHFSFLEELGTSTPEYVNPLRNLDVRTVVAHQAVARVKQRAKVPHLPEELVAREGLHRRQKPDGRILRHARGDVRQRRLDGVE